MHVSIVGALLVGTPLVAGLRSAPSCSRRAVLARGVAGAAAAAALPAFAAKDEFVAKRATDVVQIRGSGGLSSYNEMKLTSALKELADAPAPAAIKTSVDDISGSLVLIKDNKVPDVSKISQATDAITSLVLTEDLQASAASFAKNIGGIQAAIGKTDANAAAIAATALIDGLTDFCYSYDGAEKPLAELRKGTPAMIKAPPKNPYDPRGQE
jgi:hypothetical protein